MSAPASSAGPLRAEGVGLRRGGRHILSEVSVEAVAGALTGVTGPSGSGKTSLLMVLAGLIPPDEGRVLLGGRDIGALRDKDRAGLAFVPQSYGLVSSLDAQENVAVALQARGVRGDELEKRTTAALEALGLAGVARHLVDELSGGQLQRLAVARALVSDPAVLVADEPTAELDAVNRALVMGLLQQQADRGALVVVSSHDPDVTDICSQLVRLQDGRVVPVSPEDAGPGTPAQGWEPPRRASPPRD
jgi:putative ABC transport system ATP-binding protein